jgi:hypothetical protein
MIDQEISRRMDAYRGNPQALMQRYQQSQQLIDLLALQKLKSEKEAAVRSMQMAAGQQQPPTVAQQREQEVMGLTQQEVAQQVGQVAQQRAAKEREAMQRLMQGLASVPGAENAMPEQAMAAGGIVAFQEGGAPEDRTILSDRRLVDQLIEQMTLQELQEFNRSGRRTIPERLRGFARSAAPVPGERSPVGTMGAEIEATTPSAEPLPARQPQAPVDYPPYPTRGPMWDSAQTPAPQTPPPAAAQAPAPEPLMMGPPPPEAPQAGLPAALPRAPDDLRSALMAMLNPDLQAAIAQRQGMIPGMNPERLAARQKELAELERVNQEEDDPRRRLLRDLTAFFLGGAGRTSTASALAGGAQGYLQSTQAQQAAQRARLKELTTAREGLRSLEEARELEQSKAGLGALDRAAELQRTGATAATSLAGEQLRAETSRYGTDVQARTAATQEQGRALERDINRKAIADRDAERQYGILTQRRDKEYQDALADFDKQNNMLAMQVQFAQRKPSPTLEEIKLINDYERRRVAAGRAAVAQTDQVLARIAARLNVPEPTRGAAPAADASGFRIVGVK